VLSFYKRRTKIIDFAVILAAIVMMVFSHDILATNLASMMATLLLKIVQNRIRQGR